MSNRKRLRKEFETLIDKYQQALEVTKGVLGNDRGIVSVPDRVGYVYVRTESFVIQVYNERVPIQDELPVLIGYLPQAPTLLQVISTDLGSIGTGAEDETVFDEIASHHANHEWMNPLGGQDIVFSQLRQFMPLNIMPSTGTAVHVYRGTVPTLEGGWSSVYQTYLDFSGTAASLTGTLAQYMLISALPDGHLLITTGEVKALAGLGLANVPTQEFGTYPLAAIRLYAGQTQITEGTLSTDLVDLRWMPHIRESGTVGIYDNDIFEGNVRNINFVGGLFVSVTGTFANIISSGTGGGDGAPTDAEYVVMSLDAGLSDERVLTAGTDIILTDGGAGGAATIGVIPNSFKRLDGNELPIYDNDIFRVTGTLISFNRGLEVHVTGTYAYIDFTGTYGHIIRDEGTPEVHRSFLNFIGAGVWVNDDAGNDETEVIISGTHGHTIQEDGVNQTNREALNFVGDAFEVWDDAGNNATIVSGVATGDGAGVVTGTISIYEDGVFVVDAEGISFEDDILVDVTGTTVYISHLNCGTYMRTGQPTPLSSVTGSYWKVPDEIYATGSLSVFIDGLIQIPLIDFVEQFAVSGTFQHIDVPPTGSVHVIMWGVPCQTQA
jgi:hypothetical protein